MFTNLNLTKICRVFTRNSLKLIDLKTFETEKESERIIYLMRFKLFLFVKDPRANVTNEGTSCRLLFRTNLKSFKNLIQNTF